MYWIFEFLNQLFWIFEYLYFNFLKLRLWRDETCVYDFMNLLYSMCYISVIYESIAQVPPVLTRNPVSFFCLPYVSFTFCFFVWFFVRLNVFAPFVRFVFVWSLAFFSFGLLVWFFVRFNVFAPFVCLFVCLLHQPPCQFSPRCFNI